MANGKPGRPAKYTEEYKRNAVDYYLQSGKTQRECADDLGIPRKTLGKWVQARNLTEPERAMADWAAAHDVRLSVGRTGSCHDNAVAESFFGTFKNEMFHLREFATREEARVASIEYVEGYYNRRRPHSAIDCQIPAEKMGGFFARMAEALEVERRALPLAA